MNNKSLNNRLSRLEKKTAPTQPKNGYHVSMDTEEWGILDSPTASKVTQAEIMQKYHLDTHPRRKIYVDCSPDDWDED